MNELNVRKYIDQKYDRPIKICENNAIASLKIKSMYQLIYQQKLQSNS